MADGVILEWNVTNWITVTLMAAIMFALLGILQKYMNARVSNSSSGNGS